ncbi:MAG: tyrosine--tRNA ligase [Alphaproteobacteria bacterium]|nr:tyrosine--tRNA ligase [Alphaproteobacteria bacterium]
MKNELLHELQQRGFIYQCSNLDGLAAALNAGPITLYYGADPTADSLHYGHIVPILLARWFQKFGHQLIMLVGGATGRIGDPSERDTGRPMLTEEQLKRNLAGLRRSYKKVLGNNKFLMVDNYDWNKKYSHIGFLEEFGTSFTVAHMLSMESVKRRLEHGMTFLEFNYMTIQAVDFYELYKKHNCVLQICGSDQWGNSIMGIELIRKKLQKEVFVLSVPLILDSSGAKVGKSAGNAVWINEDRTSPYEYYQAFRNVADSDVDKFLKIYTELPLSEIAKLSALQSEKINEAKKILAFEATKMIHGAKAAKAAADAAAALFAGGTNAEAVPTAQLAVGGKQLAVVDFIVDAGLVSSKAEARRLIEQGGLIVAGEKITDVKATITPAETVMLQKGKKTFLKVIVK